MNNKIVYCGNCGNIGHTYRRCLAPITSLGIILFKRDISGLKYLFIQRRDTLGFVEFMRGKYNLKNHNYIFELFKIMTVHERHNIMNTDFDTLWNNLWLNYNNQKFHNEYANSKEKFNKLKKGIKIDNNENHSKITLSDINYGIPYLYKETEWGFPKGRRNLKESDIDCAKREFEEETGYKSKDYKIICNDNVFEEIFLGTNNIRYKHVYYIAESINDINLIIDKNNFNQYSEIKTIKWFNFKEGFNKIRNYNYEKKNIFKKTNTFINNLINKTN